MLNVMVDGVWIEAGTGIFGFVFVGTSVIRSFL